MKSQNEKPENSVNNEKNPEKLFSFSTNNTSFLHSLPNDKIKQFFEQPAQKESPNHHSNYQSISEEKMVRPKTAPFQFNKPFLSAFSNDQTPTKNINEQGGGKLSLNKRSYSNNIEKKSNIDDLDDKKQTAKLTYSREKSLQKVNNYLKKTSKPVSPSPQSSIFSTNSSSVIGLDFSSINVDQNVDASTVKLNSNSIPKPENSNKNEIHEYENLFKPNISTPILLARESDFPNNNENSVEIKIPPIINAPDQNSAEPKIITTTQNEKSELNPILNSVKIEMPINKPNKKSENLIKANIASNQKSSFLSEEEPLDLTPKHEKLVRATSNPIPKKVNINRDLNQINEIPIKYSPVKTEKPNEILINKVKSSKINDNSNLNEGFILPNIDSISKSEGIDRIASNPIHTNSKTVSNPPKVKARTNSNPMIKIEKFDEKSTSTKKSTENANPYLNDQIAKVEELQNQSQEIAAEITLKLRQNRKDSEIQKLREIRRNIWSQIELIESSIQDDNSESSRTTSQFSYDSDSSSGSIKRENSANSEPVRDVFPDDEEYSKEIDQELLQEMIKVNREIFHHDHFRGCQSAAVAAALQKRDLLVVMPTGGGKSLIYQMAGYIEQKLTIVISPLISLIIDQIRSLEKLNLKSSAFLGETGSQEYNEIVQKIVSNDTLFVFLTPEKLMQSDIILNFLIEINQKGMIGRFVIDEAHCVSQWGHDFRPSYKNLHVLKQIFGDVPLIALTATATEKVQNDIIVALKMQNCSVFKMSFNRPNLFYEVVEKKDTNQSYGTILQFIQDHHFENKSGLIFCMSANDTESLCNFLNEYNLKCKFYHGQMKNIKERHEVQRLWTTGKIKIIIATMAFGMGIDKADVRFVIHHTIPKSLDAYYQESGRAGRDGKLAYSLILYNVTDVLRVKRAITRDYRSSSNENENENEIIDPEENDDDMIDIDADENEIESVSIVTKKRRKNNDSVLHDLELFKSIENFCNEHKDCRRVMMMNYFNEDFDVKQCNETCDNCIRREKGTFKFVKLNMTKVSVELISIINAINQSRPDSSPYPTVRHVVNVYMGVNNGTIRMCNDSKLPQYNRGVKFKNREYVLYKVFPILVENEILNEKLKSLAHGTITIYSPGKNFNNFMRTNTPVIEIGWDYEVVPEGMERHEKILYQKLITIRDSMAEKKGEFPSAFLNFSDLKKIVLNKPKTLEDLISILPDLDQKTINLLGQKLVDAVNLYEEDLKKNPPYYLQIQRTMSNPVPKTESNGKIISIQSSAKKSKIPERPKSTLPKADDKNDDKGSGFNYTFLESSVDKVKSKKTKKDSDDNQQKTKKETEAKFIKKLKNAF